MDVLDTIRDQIETNPVIVYMKGSPNQPQCGFSARTVQALMACGERFAYVDILSNPEIRTKLPEYANWPTFPQLWVAGELIGGSQREDRPDVLRERMSKKGMVSDDIDWYVKTRDFGTVPHSGFGLGFERMVRYMTGMTNIRDVIPFPRSYGVAHC